MKKRTKRVLDKLFEYEIGEPVFLRVVDAIYGISMPRCFIITERRLQQCPGGLQVSYFIGDHVHQECEITRDRPPSRIATDEEVEEIARIENAKILGPKWRRMTTVSAGKERQAEETRNEGGDPTPPPKNCSEGS